MPVAPKEWPVPVSGSNSMAMAAIRQEGIFLDVYNRVFERTKCKMQALVAVQRKLLITMYAMTKNEMDYQINYHKKRKETA
jgi:transposase